MIKFMYQEATIMSNLNKKIVLITGGTSGYGKATAAKLVKEGATVIISARNKKLLEKSREDIRLC